MGLKKNSAIRHLGKNLPQIKAWGTKSISVDRHAYCTSQMSNPLPWKEVAYIKQQTYLKNLQKGTKLWTLVLRVFKSIYCIVTYLPMSNINCNSSDATNSIKRQHCLLDRIKTPNIECLKHGLHHSLSC